jgi:hypothetical protein
MGALGRGKKFNIFFDKNLKYLVFFRKKKASKPVFQIRLDPCLPDPVPGPDP